MPYYIFAFTHNYQKESGHNVFPLDKNTRREGFWSHITACLLTQCLITYLPLHITTKKSLVTMFFHLTRILEGKLTGLFYSMRSTWLMPFIFRWRILQVILGQPDALLHVSLDFMPEKRLFCGLFSLVGWWGCYSYTVWKI